MRGIDRQRVRSARAPDPRSLDGALAIGAWLTHAVVGAAPRRPRPLPKHPSSRSGSRPFRSPGTSSRTATTRSSTWSTQPAETTFRTVVYRQFTRDFAKPIPNAPGDRGIQGPLIHARVGDTILVHFRNLDTTFNRPHSMHFHGVALPVRLRRLLHPRLLRARRQRQARPDVHVPARRRARTRPASGPTTTTRRR